MNITELQAFIDTKPELREIINEIADYLQSNPGGGGNTIYTGDGEYPIEAERVVDQKDGRTSFINGAFIPQQIVGYAFEGTPPAIAGGAGAGTDAVLQIAGADLCGWIQITIGATPSGSNATLVEVTFTRPLAAFPVIMLNPANGATAALTADKVVFGLEDVTQDKWIIKTGASALTEGVTYAWWYIIMGQPNII